MPDSRRSTIDATMLDLFHAELEQQSSALVSGMLELEHSSTDASIINNMMRAAHSLKGAARLLKVESVEKIAHIMEDIFISAQTNKLQLSAAHIDVLLAAVDTIKHIGAGGADTLLNWHTRHEESYKSVLGDLTAIGSHPEKSRRHRGTTSEKKKSTLAAGNHAAEVDGVPQPPVNDRPDIVRISNTKIEAMVGKSSELLVQHRWLNSFVTEMIQLKKRFGEVNNLIETLRENIGAGVTTEQQIAGDLKSLSKRLRDNNQRLNQSISSVYEFYHRTDSLIEDINRDILTTRMRPFAERLTQFPRMVRDISRGLDKTVTLSIDGGNTEVDRDVLDKIEAPLTHLVRNAIAHGVEQPEQRKKLGKKPDATITISASYRAGMLHISIADDGAGIDLPAIKRKILEKKLVPRQVVDSLTDEELMAFMFLPEFSTKEQVTEISGRGFGLDVVKETVTALKGTVRVDSVPGRGTCFELQMPVTVSVVTALIVEIVAEPYAFPLARVERVMKLQQSDIFYSDGKQYFTFDETRLNLVSAGQLLGYTESSSHADTLSVVVIKDYLNHYALVVDKVMGQKELVMQPLDSRLGKIPELSACAILENGIPVLILDVDDLTRSLDFMIKGGKVKHVPLDLTPATIIKRILVVDDSITVREIERNLLETHGYHVETAVDGIDGWNAIRSNEYNLLITDIDMPRMDGFELVSLIKSDSRLKRLPVMIVSYKDRIEDRRKGLNLGADYYLTKGSFHDETLIEAVKDLIGESDATL